MRDYVIFKFREINKHLLTSLINSEIYFAQPSCLNDPFDCRVEVLRSLDNAIIKAPLERREALMKLRKMDNFFEDVQTDVSQFGVSSFSLELKNTLMWSHYANNHRGVSLMYSFPESYFYDNKDRILGVVKVDYDTNPLTDWFIRGAPNLGSFEEFGNELVSKMFSIKAKPWEYEGEARILRTTPGVESLDRKYLQQVCFGLDTAKADVALITKIIRQSGYDLTRCKMVRCRETDFGIKPEEI